MLHLSPKSLASSIGASESSIKRWIDAGRIQVSRTPGGHRRIDQREAIRFIRQNAMQVVDPAPLGLSRIVATTTSSDEHAATLRQAIVAGQADIVRATVEAMYLRGSLVSSLCDGPFAGAMHDVAELWKHSEDGVHIEHRATDACIQGLERLRSLIASPPDDSPLALGASPPGDLYHIPSLMASLTLAEAGWQTINLGPNLPWPAFERAVTHHQPRLVWISITCERAMEQIGDHIGAFAMYLKQRGCALIVGGRAWRGSPRPVAGLNEGDSMADLRAFAMNTRQQSKVRRQ